MEQNFTPLHQASNTNLKRIGIVLCGLVCILIGVIIWFMYTGNTTFLSEKADLQRDIDSRMAELSAELKQEQQNSFNQKFEDLTKVLTSLIDQKEEEYADPFLHGETQEANPAYLSITSENLIRNSSFESGENKKPRQWEYILESNNRNSIQSQETIRSGKLSMEFKAKDGSQLGISQPVTKTIAGRTYSLSLYIKTQHIDQGTTLRLGFWNEYTNTYAAMDEMRLSSNMDWYRVSTTQKTSGTISDWTNWYPVIEIRNHTSGSVFIDDVQLTEGEILIDYSSILAGSPGNTISSIIGNGSVYVNSSGSVFPAEDGIGSLGTNANRWEELYLTNATITKGGDMDLQGSLSIDDNLIVKGDTTFIDNSIFKGGINVGEHNEFTVNSEGNITSIHGIAYSFPSSQGASNEILINDGNGNLTWGTFGSASVTPDSLDFAQIADALTLDDDTSIDVYDGTLDNNFQIYNSNTSTEIAFFDGSSGNVGFGTVSPNYKVEVNGSFNATSLYLSGSQVTSSASELNYLDGTSVLAGGVMFGNGTRIAQDPANFYWNDSSNRLGIGNTDPQFTLDVNGDVRVRTGFDFYIGSIGLNDTGISRTTSGASRIGTFDEFTNSTSLTVQDVLDDLDAAITTFASGAGDIEAVGSMTSGSAFADTDADDQWLGLGMNAGRIEFDNEATNEINILSAYFGVGSTTPSALLSVGEGNELTVDVNGNLATTGTLTGSSINTGQGAYEIQDASTANKGLASFNSSHFSVSSGAVSIATGGVGPTELASTSVTAGTYGAVGGTAAYIPQITVDQDGRITAASSLPFALNFETPLSFQNGLTRTSNTIELGGSLTKDTRLHIGNTEVFFAEFTNGNVGIGTVTPSSKLDVVGSAEVSGSVTASSFSGSGSSLIALNATQLTSGTVPSARISGSYTGIVGTGALNAGSITSGFGNINIGTATFTGNGSGLTNLNASQLTTGTIPDARITGSYTGLTNLTGSGTVTFGAFSGSGASLTSLNASQLTTGTIPDARISGAYSGITNLSTTGTLTLAQNANDVLNFSASSTNDARGISFNSRTALSADSSDGYLRLNQGGEFTNGVYTGGAFRADGGLSSGGFTTTAGEVRANLFRDGNSNYYLDPANTGNAGLIAGSIGIGSTVRTNYKVSIFTPLVELKNGLFVYSPFSQAHFTDGSQYCDVNATNGMMTCASDNRLKKNIVLSEYALDTVKALRGVSFKWNTDDENDPQRIGFIAQEVEKIVPELVQTSASGYKGVSYMSFAPILVNAINEQQDIFDDKYNSLTLADASLTSRVNLLTTDLNKLSGKTTDILGIQQEVTSLDEEILYQGQQIASLQNQMDEVFNIINKEEVASEEANIASLTERVSFLEKLLGAETVSASTGEEEVEEEVDTTVMENLTVTDKINTFDLGVVGDINAGQIVVHGKDAQINSLTKALEIQSESTNPVEIMGGKVTIETNGSLTVKESVTAKKYNVDDKEEESASIGEATLKAGETEIVIETTSVTESSKIFLTPTKETDMQLAVVEKERGKSFTVKVVKEAEQDISFNWWIVN